MTEPELYDFDGNIERGIKSLLSAKGLKAFISFSGKHLPDTRIEIVHETGRAVGSGPHSLYGEQWSQYEGTLTLIISTPINPDKVALGFQTNQGDNSDKHRELSAQLRLLLTAYCNEPLKDKTPYRILEFRPTSTSYQVLGAPEFLYESQLVFTLKFVVDFKALTPPP